MINITKNWNWFFVKWNKAKWACEEDDSRADFRTFSSHTKFKSPFLFDWPWEYEKAECEIVWTEVWTNQVVSFCVRMDKVSITHIPEDLGVPYDDLIDNINDTDILLISLWEKSNTTYVKKLIDEINPRIVVFWWPNKEALADKFPWINKTQEIKINALPTEIVEYHILF